MSNIQFGATHTVTLQSHTTVDRRRRQQLKNDLGQLADSQGFRYGQQEYRVNANRAGQDFVTEITIDTGKNNPKGDRFVSDHLSRLAERERDIEVRYEGTQAQSGRVNYGQRLAQRYRGTDGRDYP